MGREFYQLNSQNSAADKETKSLFTSIEKRSNMECIMNKHAYLQFTMTSATGSHIPMVIIVLAGLYFSSASAVCGPSWYLLLFSSWKIYEEPQPRCLWENIPSAASFSFFCLDCRNLKGKPGPRSLLSYSFHLYSTAVKFWSLRTLKIQRPEICGWSCYSASCTRTYTSMANLQSCNTNIFYS